MKRILLLLIFVFSVSGILAANGILVGDGKKQSDVILVGKVVSFEENKTALETNYVVEVEEYLKTPKNYDTNTKTIDVASPGLRHYDDPQKEMIYDKIFNVGDRVLFLLYLKDEKLRESLWSLTTKSSCTPQQLLDERYGQSGLSISQNNQARHLYTNQPVDLTFHVFNRDLISEKKDFEFKVFTPVGKLSEKKQVELQECKRSAEVKWSFVPTIAGKYTFSAIIGNSEGGSESYSGVLIEDYVDSPLKQFKAGAQIDKIQCRQGLELIFKSSDNSPACVKPETKSKLTERGWTKPKQISTEISSETRLKLVGFLEGGQVSEFNALRNDIVGFLLLEGVDAFGVDLSGINLEFVGLPEADLHGAKLDGAKLHKANLLNANLQDANLGNLDLSEISLENADLKSANLKGANLEDAWLQDANLEGANLQDANLKSANLRHTILQGANLREADLQDANLDGANLQNADLQGANLKGVFFYNTNLQGVKNLPISIEKTKGGIVD